MTDARLSNCRFARYKISAIVAELHDADRLKPDPVRGFRRRVDVFGGVNRTIEHGPLFAFRANSLPLVRTRRSRRAIRIFDPTTDLGRGHRFSPVEPDNQPECCTHRLRDRWFCVEVGRRVFRPVRAAKGGNPDPIFSDDPQEGAEPALVKILRPSGVGAVGETVSKFPGEGRNLLRQQRRREPEREFR